MNNDLISREAVLNEIMKEQDKLKSDNDSVWERNKGYFKGLAWANRIIIDAPAVEPEKALIANVTFDEDKLKEIIQTEVIDKIRKGELVLESERPQGEWIEDYTAKTKRVVACNKCHCLNIMGKSNFCPNCGAQMIGGDAE